METATLQNIWAEYEAIFNSVAERYRGKFTTEAFDYVHHINARDAGAERHKRPYTVKVRYKLWGKPEQPLLVCLGGVANVAHRFDEIALALQTSHQVACLDWVGRGSSGWMHHETDYRLETYVEQVLQLLGNIGDRPVSLLGSSMGGSVAISLAAKLPGRIKRLILNDTGPFFQPERRIRRAETLSRYYVFKTPQEILRKIGASQKNDGPVSDEMRIYSAFNMTEWSEREQARVYRYDIRAMQAYKRDASFRLDQWREWSEISCPIFVIHGLESDVLDEPIIRRMREKVGVTVFPAPLTGHTPMLVDPEQIEAIRTWLNSETTSPPKPQKRKQ